MLPNSCAVQKELVYVILPVADRDAVIGMVQQSRGTRLVGKEYRMSGLPVIVPSG
jgi:hypothetical protein